jgi:hypothetical protein
MPYPFTGPASPVYLHTEREIKKGKGFREDKDCTKRERQREKATRINVRELSSSYVAK